jgi:hypothetical protein
MNRDDTIRMAREAGATPYTNRHYPDRTTHTFGPEALERFVALVAEAKDAEHKEAMRWDVHSCGPTCKRYACVAMREAVAAEREACAKVADRYVGADPIADAIRARGQQ